MPFTSGSFSLFATGNPVVTGTTVSSSWANNTLSDIATGLSTCVLKDGTQTLTANIPMSGFKLTGLAAGSATGDSVAFQQSPSGIFSSKGDLVAAAGANNATRLAVGADGTFLVANSGASTGLNWRTIATSDIATTGTQASTFTFNGSGGTSGSVTMTYQKIGNWVTVNIPTGLTATTGTTSTTFISNTALPAAIRPAATQTAPLNSDLNNGGGTTSANIVSISAGGILTIQRDQSATQWTNSTNCGLVGAVSFTYFIG